jgi:hypothetical protein
MKTRIITSIVALVALATVALAGAAPIMSW